MDHQQLVNTLQGMHVTVNDTYRAGLYFDYINQTNTFFGSAAAAGLTQQEYDFCRQALAGGLLSELAKVLDFYVAPATQGVLNSANFRNLSYQDYFNQHVFNADANTYAANVQLFRQTVPISAAAIQTATQNFQNNIRQACQRLYADRARIQNLFSDRYKLSFVLRSLASIRTTGSDFHKGGKQVLILTFNAFSTVKGVSVSMISSFPFKLVYKPSDIEGDCLLAGNSAAVNRALGTNFMANSLFEIYNNSIAAAQQADPNLQAQPLPTYRILPVAYQSGYNNAPQAALRDAYGYIEYLNYDVSIPASSFFGYCPFASSDYIIFKSETPAPIIENFYRVIGAMTAVSGTFSLLDLHVENVRIQERLPYFIDMEVCLATAVNDICGTILLSRNVGGVSTHEFGALDDTFEGTERNRRGDMEIDRVTKNTIYSNRLWTMSTEGRKRLVQVDWDNYVNGFNSGMDVLRTVQASHDFATWTARLNNVVVRYLPYATADFLSLRNIIYITRPSQSGSMGMALNIAVDDAISYQLNTDYTRYNGGQPNFVVLDMANSGVDFTAGDIPIFYHRIGSSGILNSQGQNVPIPAQMTVSIEGQAPQVIQVAPPNGPVPRNTFFAAPPTQAVVINTQVDVLADGATFTNRRNLLRGSITTFRNGLDPNVAAVFKPINA